MKISSRATGSLPRLDTAQASPRTERSTKSFSLRSTKEPTAGTSTGLKSPAVDSSSMTDALRSVASEFKSGEISDSGSAVRKMVSTILQQQFGDVAGKDKGFQQMQDSISSLIADDPALSGRMLKLLQRLG